MEREKRKNLNLDLKVERSRKQAIPIFSRYTSVKSPVIQ